MLEEQHRPQKSTFSSKIIDIPLPLNWVLFTSNVCINAVSEERSAKKCAVVFTRLSLDLDFLCRAGKDITEILVKSNIQEGFPFLKKVMRNPSEKRRRKQAADIPPPSLPYPWQAISVADAENRVRDTKFE